MRTTFLFVSFLACGGGSNTDESVDCADACRRWASAVCDRGVECGAIGDEQRAECINAAEQACGAQRGTTTQDAVDECLADTDVQACEEADQNAPSCDALCR